MATAVVRPIPFPYGASVLVSLHQDSVETGPEWGKHWKSREGNIQRTAGLGGSNPPYSLCLGRSVRGDPHLTVCGFPEERIVAFGGLKQEVVSRGPTYLWDSGLCGILPHLRTVGFPLSLLHIRTAE